MVRLCRYAILTVAVARLLFVFHLRMFWMHTEAEITLLLAERPDLLHTKSGYNTSSFSGQIYMWVHCVLWKSYFVYVSNGRIQNLRI